jgi:hypothetical protein
MRRAAEKRDARFGELDAAIAAPEQRHAEVGFQRLDLPADGAVSEMQFAGGVGKTQALGRDLEGRQRLERRQAAAHRWLFRVNFPHARVTKDRLSVYRFCFQLPPAT